MTSPSPIQSAIQLAMQHHQAGRLEQADAIYRQILSVQPNHVDAMRFLGLIALQRGQSDSAVEWLKRAVDGAPGLLEARCELVAALVSAGQWEQAIAAAHSVLVDRPADPATWYNLGLALFNVRRLNESVEAYRNALSLKPDFAPCWNNLGNALRESDRFEEAVQAFERSLAQRPGHVETHINLAETHKDAGRFDRALEGLERAIAISPDCAEAHDALARMLLLQGQFERGWREHEWRLKCRDFRSPADALGLARWDGSDLAGKRILIHAEQGFGDTLQFVRYLPLVAQRGGTITLTCQPELTNLLRPVPGVHQLAEIKTVSASEFDVQCPLLSLPLVMGTRLDSIPADVPYLHADAERSGRWREKLAEHSSKLKIGLAWAGRPTHLKDRFRSIALEKMAALTDIPDALFVSLQKGAESPKTGVELLDLAAELTDFADTAGLIDNLDLVISVDTAVAHLAGAMGKPVWVLLPYVPDWRWMLEREDSLWYPTMKLFRQPKIGDWESPVQRIVEALRSFKITS